MDYKKLSEKLPAKLEDIFEPTIKINVGMNEIAALCDLGASVSTIPKSLFDRLNLGTYVVTDLKLHLTDSTFKQAGGIKENIVVQIKGCPALIDLVINLHEGKVRFELPLHDPFVVHFPRKKKSKVYDNGIITLKANYFGH